MPSNNGAAEGGVDFCNRAQSVRFAGREARLPDLSFRLFRLLSEHAPAPVTFGEIERVVWNAHVTRETIKQRAKLLRDILVTLGLPEEAVASVRSVGYRLTVPSAPYESSPAGRSRPPLLRWRALTIAGLLLGLIGAATVLTLEGRRPPGAARIAIVQTPAASGIDPRTSGGVARDLADYLSHVEGIDVLAAGTAGDRASDLIIELAITGPETDARLSMRLIDQHSGLVLLAEDYPYEAADHDRSLAHFANTVHETIETLDLRLGRAGQSRQPRAAREEYGSILNLVRGASEPDLLVAQERLDRLIAGRPRFAQARALRVRVAADLVLRHGHNPRRAAGVLAEARSLVEAYPFVADFRYALARAEMATGDHAAALRDLNSAARGLPFLQRDIQALERQIATADNGAEAP